MYIKYIGSRPLICDFGGGRREGRKTLSRNKERKKERKAKDLLEFLKQARGMDPICTGFFVRKRLRN